MSNSCGTLCFVCLLCLLSKCSPACTLQTQSHKPIPTTQFINRTPFAVPPNIPHVPRCALQKKPHPHTPDLQWSHKRAPNAGTLRNALQVLSHKLPKHSSTSSPTSCPVNSQRRSAYTHTVPAVPNTPQEYFLPPSVVNTPVQSHHSTPDAVPPKHSRRCPVNVHTDVSSMLVAPVCAGQQYRH